MNTDIIPLLKEQIPTVLSYDYNSDSFFIGDKARDSGLIGRTNIYNFKIDCGESDKEFSQHKKYWVAPVDFLPGKEGIKTFSPKEVTVIYIKELLSLLDQIPKEVIIGEPSIKDPLWKEHFRSHIREVFNDIGVVDKIQFFPEPFAVFQYYRHFEKIFPVVKSPEIVLVIDIGGGTFNSCILRTTIEGNLARSGSTMLPLGLQAELCGGSQIYRYLLGIIVSKVKENTPSIIWHEDPLKRIDAHGSILLTVENAKIQLSNSINKDEKLSTDLSDIKVNFLFKEGTLHPDKEISGELTGEELKLVLRNIWRKRYGKIINATLLEAKDILANQNITFERINRVLIAGGSSRLPFMKEEIMTVLPTLVKSENIYTGQDNGLAVAIGIACECREQIKKYPDLSINKLAPCQLSDLYIGFRQSRREPIIAPTKIRYQDKSRSDGQLFISPFVIDKTVVTYDIEFPFDLRAGEKIYYYFCDQPFQNRDEINELNVEQSVFLIRTKGRLKRSCKLEIEIGENGFITPTFIYQEKGLGAKKAPTRIKCHGFYTDNLKIKEGYPFIGIDFGTSNSYLCKFLSVPTKITPATYPEFTVKANVMEQIRKLESEIRTLSGREILNRQVILKHAQDQKLLMVFHSNKIEGSPLTRGETEEVLKKETKDDLTKHQKEAFNVQQAYEWVLENYKSYQQQPENFLRHINKTILEDVVKGGGEYRDHPVTIAGMDFIPPNSASVPAFMENFGSELKKGPNGRSVIEFAATMHTKFVYIHPFTDGNGRTARLLLNAILLTYELPIIVINYADKQRYLDALFHSNKGDLSSTIEYFIECFREQLFEIVQGVALPEQEFIDKQNTDEKSHKEDPIKEAFESIDLKSDVDPLNTIMMQRILKLKESVYEGWRQSYNTLLAEIKVIINEFNTDWGYAGFKMSLREYDILSFEKFMDIVNGKKISQTWFFSFEILDPSNIREALLFIFERCPASHQENPNISKVCINIVHFDGASGSALTSEPIKLRSILHCDGDLIFWDNDNNVIEKSNTTLNFILKSLVADVIKTYFI